LRRRSPGHDSANREFDAQLRDLCAQLDARLAFDAVGGDMTERLLAALPRGSRVTVYGGLAALPFRVFPQQPIFDGKIVDGFWIPSGLARKNPLQLLLLQRRVVSLLDTALRSEVRARVSLERARDALAEYTRYMTRGKILLIPAQRD
jgi:NADPH2:quinone reductase